MPRRLWRIEGRVLVIKICPQCGERQLSLVGDGYNETYRCMSCLFDAGRFLENTPERGAVEISAEKTK